jgi:hypothetical protein
MLSERRMYYTTLEQVVPIKVRGSRKGEHLPAPRWDPPSTSLKVRRNIDRWLAKKVGLSWDKILHQASRIPTVKSNQLSYPEVKRYLRAIVKNNTFLVGTHVFCYVQGGRSFPIEQVVGLYVHPVDRTLCSA